MKINSDLKLKKQAEQYIQENPVVMSESWQREYKEIEIKFKAARKKWQQSRDAFCKSRWGNGEKCRCKDNPDYIRLALKVVEPLSFKLNQLYDEKTNAEKIKYEIKYESLRRARDAKLQLT